MFWKFNKGPIMILKTGNILGIRRTIDYFEIQMVLKILITVPNIFKLSYLFLCPKIDITQKQMLYLVLNHFKTIL